MYSPLTSRFNYQSGPSDFFEEYRAYLSSSQIYNLILTTVQYFHSSLVVNKIQSLMISFNTPTHIGCDWSNVLKSTTLVRDVRESSGKSRSDYSCLSCHK